MTGSVTAQLQLCAQLESQLRAQEKELNFWDRHVREVRKQLRTALKGILLQNYKVAQEKQLEFTLWHVVFYRPISEFRRRIAEVVQRGEKGREALPKLRNSFQSLLTDATGFYRALIVKLQAIYGDVGCQLPDNGLPVASDPAPPGLQTAAGPQDVHESVYRCLICLGDVARYEANLSPEKKKDWSKADDLYRRAIVIHPEGGNAYNQRAVLAGIEGRDLAAVYSYFRSLAVAAPFHIARENLMQLFEQVRARYEKLPRPALGRSAAHRGPPGKLPELQRVVETRILRLHGLLFTKIDLDAFTTILPVALADLSDFLGREVVVRGPLGHGPQRSDVAIFQMAVLSLFAIYNGPLAAAEEVGKRLQLHQFALELLFSFAAHLAKALAGAGVSSGEGGMPASPLLPAMSVLLQWMVIYPKELRDFEAKLSGPRSQLCKALAELMVVGAACCETAGISLPLLATKEGQPVQALSEDRELRCFEPLKPAHSQLTFDSAVAPEDEQSLRLQRVMVSLYQMAEGFQVHIPNVQYIAPSNAADKAVASFISKVNKAFGMSAPEPAKLAANADDEEGEEVIMFQPTPSLPAAPAPQLIASPAALTPRASEAVPMVTSPEPLAAQVANNSSVPQLATATPPAHLADTSSEQQLATATPFAHLAAQAVNTSSGAPPARATSPTPLAPQVANNSSGDQPETASLPLGLPAAAQQDTLRGWDPLMGNVVLPPAPNTAQRGFGAAQLRDGAAGVTTVLPGFSGAPYETPGGFAASRAHAGLFGTADGALRAAAASLPGSSVGPFSRTVSPGILSDGQRDSAGSSRVMSAAQQLSQEQFSRPPTRPGTPGVLPGAHMLSEARPAPPGFPSATHLGNRSANATPTPALGLLPPLNANFSQPGMNSAPTAGNTSSLLQAQLAGLSQAEKAAPASIPSSGLAGQGLWASSAGVPSGEGIWGNAPHSVGYPGGTLGLGQLPGAKLDASDGFGASLQSYLQGRGSGSYGGGGLPLSPMPSGLPTELFGRDLMEQLGPLNGGTSVAPSSNPGLGPNRAGLENQIVRDPWGSQVGTNASLGGLSGGQQDWQLRQQQLLLSAGLGQSHLGQAGLGDGLAQVYNLPQQQRQQPQASTGIGYAGGGMNGQQSWQQQQQQQQQFGQYAAQQSAALNQLTAQQLQGLSGLPSGVATASSYQQFQSLGGLGGLQSGNSGFVQGGQVQNAGAGPLQSYGGQHLGSQAGIGGNFFGLQGGQNLGGLPLGSQAFGAGPSLGAQQQLGGRQSPWGTAGSGPFQNAALRNQQHIGLDPRAGSPAQLSSLGQGTGAWLPSAAGQERNFKLGTDDSWLDAFEQQQRQLAASNPAGTPPGALQQAFGGIGQQASGGFRTDENVGT